MVYFEVAEAFRREKYILERMTRARAERVMATIDRNFEGLTAREYMHVLFDSLKHTTVLPLNPMTYEPYTIRHCSHIQPGTDYEIRRVLGAVHKFYLQALSITEEYIHPKRRALSTTELLDDLKRKAPKDKHWQRSLTNINDYAKAAAIN